MKNTQLSFSRRVHDLFFTLSFLCPLPTTFHVFLWLVEKCTLMAPLFLPIFEGTPWDYLVGLIQWANPLHYFGSSAPGFATFCIVLFAAFHCFLGVLVFRIVRAQNSATNWVLAAGFPLVHSVLLQVVGFTTGYLFVLLLCGDGTKFSAHSGIPVTLVTYMSPMHIVLCALHGLMLAEAVAIDLLDVFLLQEDRLSIRCTRSWKLKVLDLVSRLCIVAVFVCDSAEDYTAWSLAVLGAIFVGKIMFWYWVPAVTKDMPEYAYDFWMLLLVIFNAISTEFGLKNCYQYSAILPVYVAMACVIRKLLKREGVKADLKCEDDVLDYMRTMVRLFTDTDISSLMQAYGLLEKHRATCVKADCGCRTFTFVQFKGEWNDQTKLNYATYETGRDMPERVAKSCKRRVMGMLLGDIKPVFAKSPAVALGMAEIYYYFLANPYESLLYVQSVEQNSTSMSFRQGTTNIRSVIEEGISKTTDEAVALVAALEFQTEYYSFLSFIEYSCECTVKFWKLLEEDRPDPAALSRFGQEIYETSQKLFQLVKDINRASPDHIEFLFKFGLYAKCILHDKVSSAYAFQRLLWNTENAALHSRKDQLMTLVVSMEQRNFFSILDVNTELEHQLGFRREELLGLPATRLMHSCVAKQHREMVNRYFRSMKSTLFGTEKQQFFKHQDGCIVTCKGTKKMVPTLATGVRGTMLFFADPSVSSYTAQRTDYTRRRTGVLLCDAKGRVTEYTNDAEEVGLHREVLLAGTSLSTVFPELRDERVFTLASRPQGVVLLFNPANGNEESCPDELEGEQKGVTSKAAENGCTLMWVRVTKEECGDEQLIIVVFAPILKQALPEYRPNEDLEGKVFQRADQMLRLAAKGRVPRHRPESSAGPTTSDGRHPNGGFDMGNEMASQSGSTESADSFGSVRTQSTDAQDSLLHDEMHQQEEAGNTPAIIKRLRAILGIFLTVVIVLIGVETTQFYNEVTDLTGRFELIEYFTIRYELLLYMSACPMNYDLYRKSSDAANFVAYCVRARARANRAASYNVLLKKSFNSFGMEYDYDRITVYDGNDSYPVAFDYALLNYINRIMTYTSLNDYYVSKYCVGNYTSPICRENNLALDYCSANGITTILPEQTRVSKVLIADLLSIAVKGRDSLYVLISVCISAVVLSSLLLLVLLIWVIKGKSRVVAIFAEVLPEEISTILTQARSLNISEVRFDSKYVAMCENNEDKFWRYFYKHTHLRKTVAARRAAASKAGLAAGIPQPEEKSQDSEEEVKGKEAKKEGDDDEKEESKGEEAEKDVESEKLRLELAQREKYDIKKGLLGQIDSSLRNRSILKLGVVLGFFLVYGGLSLYFNYYVHDFNNTTTSFFYVLTKRDTYTIVLSTLLRQAVRLKDKQLLQYSNDSSVMYMMDYLDEIQRGETRIKDYNTREANSRIFSGYLDLCSKLDSALFCQYVDSYNVGQTGACNTSYGGPKLLGLTVGVAYLVDYHIAYAAKILNADFTNDTVVAAFAADPGLSFPGSKVMIYLQSALEQELIQYRKDAVAFYKVIEAIIMSKAVCFAVLFLALYVAVFAGLLATLRNEIWLTKGMLSMIPRFVLENNLRVQKLVHKRRRTAMG
ncbi:MAG: PAS domain S-box protein [Candidatus Pacebacteria bacterium]|nr:PAS domain S-box protein [Candidatus Paceibacterota bacterium]